MTTVTPENIVTTVVIQTSDNTVEIQTTGAQGDGSGGGGGDVASVSAANATLTISPTTGVVLAALNLANPNTWTGLQTFRSGASVADGVVIDGSTNPYVGAATAYGVRTTRTTNGDNATPASITGDSLTVINNGPSGSEDSIEASFSSIGRDTSLTVACGHQFDMLDGGENICGHRNYVTTTGTFIGGNFDRTVYGDEVFVNASNGVNCSGNYVDNIYGRYTKVQVNGATQNGVVSGTIWGHYIQVTNGEASRAGIGLEIVGVTGTANSFALKVSSTTKSYFAGKVGFNNQSPISPVDVVAVSSINVPINSKGAVGQTAPLFSASDSTDNYKATITAGGGFRTHSSTTAGVELVQTGTGQLAINGFGGSNNENLTINLESTINGATIFSTSGVTTLTLTSITLAASISSSFITITDNGGLVFGSASDTRIEWDTTETNDCLKITTACGSSAQSGNIIICEQSDVNVDFGHATTVDPFLIIHSADAGTVADWIGLKHNQTNAIVQWGSGSLNFVDPSGSTTPLKLGTNQLAFFGASLVSQSPAYTITNASTDRTFDANSYTMDELADFVCTLASDIKLTGLIG